MSESSLARILRSRGLRLTAQRQLVLEAVHALGHATPDQVHAEVARTAAGVNITTVYRTLELLEELGLVTHAHLTHGAPTYHTVGATQHVHLVCRRCGRVDEAPSDLLRPLADTLDTERGFLIDIGHVALFGLCAECGGRGGPRDGEVDGPAEGMVGRHEAGTVNGPAAGTVGGQSDGMVSGHEAGTVDGEVDGD